LHKATYTIIAAEGIKDKDGNLFIDSSSGIDSFGHQKLSGVGASISKTLQDYSKKDTDYWKDVFERNGVFVENINKLPEVRDLLPGHLVRCGHSTPYDISFGKQCGGAAVTLLLNGITGVTVAGINEGEIRYMPIKEAIKQRYVNIKDVEFYEKLGICFGRKQVSEYKPNLKQIEHIERYM